MISEVDIRDWETPAINGEGWEVQWFSDSTYGWIKISAAYETKSEAKSACLDLKLMRPESEFRVYEALAEEEAEFAQ